MAAEDATVLRDAFAVDTCVPAPERCNGVDDDCDGRVDETPEADTACAIPNASAACIGGRCVLARCDADHGDCDGDAANGCETPLRANADHCGSCGRPCIGLDICVAGSCGPMTDLDVGTDHACAVHASGRVLCWGRNDWAQLGDGTRVDRARPVEVLGLGPASIVRVGDRYSCALSRDRLLVSCWGKRELGGPRDETAVVHPTDDIIIIDRTTGARAARQPISMLFAGANHFIASYEFTTRSTTREVAYISSTGNLNSSGRSLDRLLVFSDAGWGFFTPWHFYLGGPELRTGEANPQASFGWTCRTAQMLGEPSVGECHRYISSDDRYAEVTRAAPVSAALAIWTMVNGALDPAIPAVWQSSIDGQLTRITHFDRLAGGEEAMCGLLRGASAWVCGRVTWDVSPVERRHEITLATRPFLPHDLQRLRLFHHGEGGCFLSGGGRVLCWGQNHRGRLGDGTTTDRPEPVVVLGR